MSQAVPAAPQHDEVINRDALIEAHVNMAIKMARRMARRLPHLVSRDDVESAALLGLTEAASRYDNSRSEPFMAFAAKRVRGAILDHLRRNDVLTRRGRRDARRVRSMARELEAELGRPVTDSEIAKAMGISDSEFHSHYSGLREVSVVHLEDLRTEPLGTGAETINECARRQQEKAVLMRALDTLGEREHLILSCYYQGGLTLREIGEIFDVTESRVCQIHTQALKKLRKELS